MAAVAALLCGLFYGAFFLSVYQQRGAERARKLFDRKIVEACEEIGAKLADEASEWPWGPDDLWHGSTAFPPMPPILRPGQSLADVIRTGFEDG